MKRFRPSLIGLSILLGACERVRAPARGDSTRVNTAAVAESVTSTLPARDWDPSAGPVLLVAAETPARAYVVLPEAATAATELANIPHAALVTLFGRGGTV